MRNSTFILVAGFLLLLLTSAANAQVTALRFGKLVDGHGGVISDAVVIVEGTRISKVGSGDTTMPTGA